MFVRWTDKSGDDVVFDLENIATLRRRHTEIKAIDVCGETVTTTRETLTFALPKELRRR